MSVPVSAGFPSSGPRARASSPPTTTAEHIALLEDVTARNYDPLPVVLSEGRGAWVTDVEGRRYLDCLAGYSALNFGHAHPVLVEAAREQLGRLTLTSRAFHNDRLGLFCRDLGRLAGMDEVLPMNTGAEAVETAIKLARRWGYEVKGVPDGQARIIAAAGNFHGRTTTIIGFSTDDVARRGFGPFTPGFTVVPFGDIESLREAITPTTVAVLLEPIQGEGGVIIPPAGYLPAVREACTANDVLLLADEIQSGLGRTGTTFACEVEGVVPDVYILGKALGGGIVPVSAVVSRADVLGVITPGSHGSTFGGNPLAAAVGSAVVGLLDTGVYQARARDLGKRLEQRLHELIGRGVTAVRSRGLWAGVDIDPALMTGRAACERLAEHGVLVKETHGSTIRLAPPLVIEAAELDWAIDQLAEVLDAGRRGPVAASFPRL
jgi:ornithine--oxo-acid transaminase